MGNRPTRPETRQDSRGRAGDEADGRVTLNRERPPSERRHAPRGRSRFNGDRRQQGLASPSTMDGSTVLGGVKGALVPLGGSAALDPACARCLSAIVDGDRREALQWG
jgi:hypothetical protein